MVQEKNILASLFGGLQNQMQATLSTNRDVISHCGSKGDALENAWIEWLRKYLPNKYNVDKGIVIDSEGATSDQIDIIIYDNLHTPFIFHQNGFYYIPAEAVYAVFEVKPDIDGNINYAGEKVQSVRKLKRTSIGMINSGKEMPARQLTHILGGILTSTNSYTHDNNDTIIKHLKDLQGLQAIDLGCIADYGCFYAEYNGEYNKENQDLQKQYEEYYKTRKFNECNFITNNSLVAFSMQLITALQKIGTVGAIDLNVYTKNIGIQIR